MAEKAAIFWGMIGRQGCLARGGVTGFAVPFRFFFLHGHEAFVVFVMRQWRGLFRGGEIQEEQYSQADHGKESIIQDIFLLGGHSISQTAQRIEFARASKSLVCHFEGTKIKDFQAKKSNHKLHK